jgi:K(+)-stimulated pyrophosphate-energized sodium pump
MVIPGLITIVTPVVMGLGTALLNDDFNLGAEVLGGYMAGVCVSGVMWAIFQNNAGGAWDNAKKSFEAGVEINGETFYKHKEDNPSPPHQAAVTGDTVGDPFKDTSGPSMNILIKLTCLIGLVIAPILGDHNNEDTVDSIGVETEEVIEIKTSSDDLAKATIITTYIENGEEKQTTQVIEGTLEEVESQVEAMRGEGVHGMPHYKIDKTKGEISKSVSIEVEKKKS